MDQEKQHLQILVLQGVAKVVTCLYLKGVQTEKLSNRNIVSKMYLVEKKLEIQNTI